MYFAPYMYGMAHTRMGKITCPITATRKFKKGSSKKGKANVLSESTREGENKD